MKLYQIVEQGKGVRKTYIMGMPVEELTGYLKGKQDAIGYIPGLGGDKTYSIVAWEIGKCGEGYIDLERIWKRYGK